MERQQIGGAVGASGQLKATKIVNLGDLRTSAGIPKVPWAYRLKNLVQHRYRGLPGDAATAVLGRLTGVLCFQPQLKAMHFRPDLAALGLDTNAADRIRELTRGGLAIGELGAYVPGADKLVKLQQLLRDNVFIPDLAAYFGGELTNYGVLSTRKVTTAGVAALVDAWQNIIELEILKFHGVGTTNTAEANTDTALVAESTTILNPDSTRATGSLTEGASNVFRTVGTLTFDGAGAIVEHGIFSQAATGGGTLWDRSVFSVINVASLDSIQFTYDMTATAEP